MTGGDNVRNAAEATKGRRGFKRVMTHQLWMVKISVEVYKAYAASCPENVPAGSSEASPTVLFWYNNPHTTPLENGQDVVVHFPFEKREDVPNPEVDESFRKTPHLGALVACLRKREVATTIPPYSQQVLRKALEIETTNGSAVTSKKKKATITRLSRRAAEGSSDSGSQVNNDSMNTLPSPMSTYSGVNTDLVRTPSQDGSCSSPISVGLTTSSLASLMIPPRAVTLLRRNGTSHPCLWQDADEVMRGDCVVASFGAVLELCVVLGSRDAEAGEQFEGTVLRRSSQQDVATVGQYRAIERAFMDAALTHIVDTEAPLKVMGAEMAFDQSCLTIVYAAECTLGHDMRGLATFLRNRVSAAMTQMKIEFRRVCMNEHHCSHGTRCNLGMACGGKCHCSFGYNGAVYHEAVTRFAQTKMQ